MSNFTFENIDSKKFEQLVNALGAEYIARGLRIYGSGTDGGREATYRGKMKYPSATEPWDGYLVVQCKQKQERGKTPKEETEWAIAQLDAEMAKYQTAKRKRKKPEYFLFVTNAQMSAQLETGGKDKFEERLNHWADELEIKAADFWDRDKLNNLLDGSPKIAQRFGLLHDGDIISYVAQQVLARKEGIDTTLSVFLQEELLADQNVNLAQAGHTNDDPTPLARVFVDLRATEQDGPSEGFYVVREVQHASDRPIYPSLLEQEREAVGERQRQVEETAEDELEDLFNDNLFGDIEETSEPAKVTNEEAFHANWLNPSRFVVVGGPGQGKSTLAQHLAQRHRAALLKAYSSGTLEPDTHRILRVIEEGAEQAKVGLPTHARWPFRVTLEHFADALFEKKVSSVLDYIASQVRKRTGRDFETQDAEQLLATTPWFVAFDGLDEVPAASNRNQVLDAVRRFLAEARDKDADLLVIATTRPQGYENDFAAGNFNHLNLTALSTDEALYYAHKFVEVKYSSDSDRRAKIMQRLEAASREEATARLMASPLQVTIMASLVDLVGNPPRERYELFQRYYDVIYQREQERGHHLSGVLGHYKSHIKILHDRIGLLLQVEAESKGKTEGRISRERLEKLIHDYLVGLEFEGEKLQKTKTDFLDVAFRRLVFLVQTQDQRYGFEVRSLQEFSAARALMRGQYESLKVRLRAIAPVPYWRNTFLFAVGGAFFDQNEPQCDMVMQLCRELNDNEQDPVLSSTLAGSRLALDIIEDGIVESQPLNRRLFFETALQLLTLPHAKTAERLALIYTPEDENRYKSEIIRVVAGSAGTVSISLFQLLASLAKTNEVKWAWPRLKELWPSRIEDERLVLETIVQKFDWVDDWSVQTTSRIAGSSAVGWVSNKLGQKAPIKWIRDSIFFARGRTIRAVIDRQGAVFNYSLGIPTVTPEMLDRLLEEQPTHTTWLPFTIGRAYFLNRTPETLADLLEGMAECVTKDSYSTGVGWQLQALLNESDSPEEMYRHAHRARIGELGSAQDWQAAEDRWEKRKLDTKDFVAFTDEEWPFTVGIGTSGVQTYSNYGYTEEQEFDEERARPAVLVDTLLKAFSDMPSARRRADVAANILYVLQEANNSNSSLTLPPATLLKLADATPRQVSANTVLGSTDPELDLTEELSAFEQLGNRLSSVMAFDNRTLSYNDRVRQLGQQLAPLVGTKKIREGILRLLASLAVEGVQVPFPTAQLNQLSPLGRVSLVAINLFANIPLLAVHELCEQAVELWSVQEPINEHYEMRRVIHGLLSSREEFCLHQIIVLHKLYGSSAVEAPYKTIITEKLLKQLQYRQSGLLNRTRKTELAMDWLFEAFEQESRFS
jgi:hypothetical protein